MTKIINLFKTQEQVSRTIQKVIKYQACTEDNVQQEIDEYVVTNHIREALYNILERIDEATSTPGVETGIWVSGFYGSGKSSFSKYLGLAFDRDFFVNGQPFVERFAARIDDKRTEQRLKTVTNKLNAAVMMLDLADDQITGIQEVSELLYFQTLRWLGYCSKSAAIANFEIQLEEDGLYEKFCERFRVLRGGKLWEDEHDKLMISRGVAEKIAAELYPGLKIDLDDDKKWSTGLTVREKAKKMIKLIRRKTGKDSIFFVIDEVGQYLAARPSQILDMDGLAKCLSTMGEGKVFLVGTAQQTLTEDSKSAQINSAQLFKLKDRFPGTVILESSDIEEICRKRLLGKSSAGETELHALFDANGARLAQLTQLKNCPDYELGGLKEQDFVSQYPFTPVYFQLLLRLLSELSRTTGGVGLRSAIKVVQDVLIHGNQGERLADAPVGKLVTAVNFYDELYLDIEKSCPAIAQAAKRTLLWCGCQGNEACFFERVAKTLVITSILKDFIATAVNVAALMQDDMAVPVDSVAVERVLKRLASANEVPVAEDGKGAYLYLSDKLMTIESERNRYTPYSSDVDSEFNDIIKRIFSPFDKAQTPDGLSVNVALRRKGVQVALTGSGAPIALEIVLYAPGEREQYLKESLAESNQDASKVFFLAQQPERCNELIDEVLRSKHIYETRGSDAESDVREYAKDQAAKADRDRATLRQYFIANFKKGELVAHGTSDAISSNSFEEVLKEKLRQRAQEVFSKAWLVGKKKAQTDTAHRFLQSKLSSPSDERNDPLHLVDVQQQTPVLAMSNPVVVEVLAWLQKQPDTTGNRIFDHFNSAPYGWGSETVLYLLAVLFRVGKLEFEIAGTPYEVVSKPVLDCMTAPKKFSNVSVRIRSTQIASEDLARTGAFLEKAGITEVSYSQEGIESAKNTFVEKELKVIDNLLPQIKASSVYGDSRLETMKLNLQNIKNARASNFIELIKNPQEGTRLESDVDWVLSLQNAQNRSLFSTLNEVNNAVQDFETLLEKYRVGVKPSKDELDRLLQSPTFFNHTDDMKMFCLTVKEAVRVASTDLFREWERQRQTFLDAMNQAIRSRKFSDEEENKLRAWADCVVPDMKSGAPVSEISRRLTEVMMAHTKLETQIEKILQDRPVPKVKTVRSIRVDRKITTVKQIADLIAELQALKAEMGSISEIEVTVQ